MNLLFTKFLISQNEKLIQRTAIKDCHALGLHSFIINTDPKIRLFIADKDCELRQTYNLDQPIVPIHAHKYEDLFFTLEGRIYHHLYQHTYNKNVGEKFKAFRHIRLNDLMDKEIEILTEVKLTYFDTALNPSSLPAKQLHTVSIGKHRCSWLIVETFEDLNFNQVAYHKNPQIRKDLYNKFPDAVRYLQNYFK